MKLIFLFSFILIVACSSTQNNKLSSIFHLAYRGNLSEIKKRMEKTKIDFSLVDFAKMNALHFSVMSINNESSLNEKQKKENVENRIELLKFLIDNGCPINARDSLGVTPLRYATDLAPIEIVAYLLERGADPNVSDSDLYTPLHFAVNHKDVNLVKLLLSYKANPRLLDNEGDTPIDLANQNPNEMNEDDKKAMAEIKMLLKIK